MEKVQEIIEQVTHTLGDIAQSDVVVGAPLEVGGVTVVPVSRVAAGFGGGGGEGGEVADPKNRSESAGTGRGGGSLGGAIVRPVAVAVFGPDGVDILPIAERQGKLEKLLDQIPQLIERIKDMKESRQS